ncbi:GIY-YIG nuclease family protein [Lacihabitans soyangensis]|uniref:GIY-YIG nuclease family protein n=1 Tax=Lacihabitans soyangensis TaxID=869394 RepID=A0AAE3H174_9BACT|nr:GIY-YIG nuclease family protein [Lacihabitans soyangensis]MCP9762136.1 GIY-YIG nuclease family protein [Lacihabitans soyangensis]
MNHFVNILFSQSLNKFYVGESTFPFERVKEHNTGKYGKSFTKQVNDWEINLFIELENRNQALIIEKKIKSMKSSKYIENLKKYPEMIEKLIVSVK